MNTLALGNWPSKLSALTQEIITRIEGIIPLLQKNRTGIEIAIVAAAVEGLLIEISPPIAGFTAVFGLSTGAPIAIVHYLDKQKLL